MEFLLMMWLGVKQAKIVKFENLSEIVKMAKVDSLESQMVKLAKWFIFER